MSNFRIRHCEYLQPNENAVTVTIEDSCGNLFSGLIKLNDACGGKLE